MPEGETEPKPTKRRLVIAFGKPTPAGPTPDPFARTVGVCCLKCRTASSFPPQSVTATLRCLKCGAPLWPPAEEEG